MAPSYCTEPSILKPTIIHYSVNTKLPISAPIKIPKVSSTERIEEYALNCNLFHPGKMSPPDSWKNRLAQRIKHYEEDVEKE
jgi:hypothetical protein